MSAGDRRGLPPIEDVQARAREGGFDEEAFAIYLRGIEEGRTERTAAKATGIGYSTIRGWYEDHRKSELHRGRFERVLDARETEIQRRLDENDALPQAIGMPAKGEDEASGGIHPQAAALAMKNNQWRLEGLDPQRFVVTKHVKQETTGKDGGPVKSDITITLAEAHEIAED